MLITNIVCVSSRVHKNKQVRMSQNKKAVYNIRDCQPPPGRNEVESVNETILKIWLEILRLVQQKTHHNESNCILTFNNLLLLKYLHLIFNISFFIHLQSSFYIHQLQKKSKKGN